MQCTLEPLCQQLSYEYTRCLRYLSKRTLLSGLCDAALQASYSGLRSLKGPYSSSMLCLMTRNTWLQASCNSLQPCTL